MSIHRSSSCLAKTVLVVVTVALALPAAAQQPSATESLDEFKATMAASEAILRQYEWIETTVVSLRGEEKSRKQQRCYYGADGGIQKVEISATPPPREKRGLRGKIAANVKEGMTEYMQSAVSLVAAYVPPDPRKLQAAKDNGTVSIDMLGGNRARLNFRHYVKRDDTLSVEVDMANNRPLRLTVATYLEDTKDAVTLNVRMGQLVDGTLHPAHTTLEAKAKNLTVDVKNSGYRRL